MLGLTLTLTLSLAAPPPQALLDRLGAGAFADREQAGRELTGYGPDALPALHHAARSHPDPEVRRRAADIAERVVRLAETAARLAVAPVKLEYAGVPLTAAVNDLRSRTGIPLVLDPSVADPARTVTVRAGELPPWEAVEHFCRVAGLHEVVRAEVPVGPVPGEAVVSIRRRTPTVGPFHPDAPAAVPLVLADGADPRPGDRSGGVRVQAVPADFAGHRVIRGVGVTQLVLDVSPLPMLAGGGRWEEVTEVKVRRAEDDRGRPVPAAYRETAPEQVDAPANWVAFGGGFGAPGLLSMMPDAAKPTTRPNPRLASVSLRTGDRPIRSLSVLEGVVLGEVTLPNQPLISVDDLSRATGAGTSGSGEVRLAVLGFVTDPVGRTTIRLRVDTPNPWTFPRANRQFNLLNAPGFQPLLLGPLGGPAAAYRFTDAVGRPCSPSGALPGQIGDDGFRQSTELEFRFDRRDGAGPPTRLTLVGEKTVPVEVPFRLRDVPLP